LNIVSIARVANPDGNRRKCKLQDAVCWLIQIYRNVVVIWPSERKYQAEKMDGDISGMAHRTIQDIFARDSNYSPKSDIDAVG
jgi:hypothetical protein